MSILLEEMKNDVKALCESYKSLSWWKQLFYPRGLGSVLLELNNEEPYSLLHVYQTFFSNAWFFQRWTYSSLRLFSSSLATSTLKLAYQKIEGLDDVDNLDEMDNERWNMLNVAYFITNRNGPGTDIEYIGEGYLANVLIKIQEADLLTRANIEDIYKRSDLCTFIDNFKELYRDNNHRPVSPLPFVPPLAVQITKRIHAPDPQIQKNTQALITASITHSSELGRAIKVLRENGLLNSEHAQAIFDIVIRSENPWSTARSFKDLKNCGLLESEHTPTIMHLMVTRCNSSFASAFQKLHERGLLKGEFATRCIDAMVNPREDLNFDENHYAFAWILATLQGMNLLQGTKAETNFNAVMNHRQPSSFNKALYRLKRYKLLSATHGQANFDAIINHKYPKKVTIALETLNEIGLLEKPHAQANFDALIPNNPDPLHIARTLAILHKVDLLTETQTQTNVRNIVKYQDLITDNYLLSRIPAKKMTQDYLDELITICQQSELSADERRGQIVLSWLKNSPEAFAYVEDRDDLYACKYVSSFIDSTIKDLHQREEKRLPNTLFDLTDDEESRFCFYIIRNLIRNNSNEAQKEIRFLLSIPAVKALAATEGASGKNTNELFKLAVTLDNKEAAAILLEIPEVKKLAEQHNYYLKEDSSKSKSYATSSKLRLFGQNRAEESDANDDVDQTNTSSLIQRK